MNTTSFALFALGVLGGAPAYAQSAPPIVDNFESYQVGSGIAGQGPWDAWDGNLAADSYVSDDVAASGTRSLEIVGASDTIIETKFMTNGCFQVRAKQFIPNNFSGTSYFLLLNSYQHGSPYSWSLQLEFDSLSGMINDESDVTPLEPFVKNRWVQLGVKVDLFADQASVFYDGSLLYSDVWSTHLDPAGVPAVEALDLYANSASSIYYDDVEIVPCLELTGPDPGYPGLSNEFVVDGATPGSTVAVLYGTQQGPNNVFGCPGTFLPFTDPGVIGQAVANGQGVATITRTIPIQASGRTATFIAVERSACRISNANEHTFP